MLESLNDLADPLVHLTSKQLVSLSDLDADEVEEWAHAWPSIEPRRRLSILNDLAELAEDNVELNFDAIYKNALSDEEASVRAAALRGLYEYEGRDLIERLIEILRSDPDLDVRREGAVALGRYALASELGQLRPSDVENVRSSLIESVEDEDEDETVRARALEALGAMSGEETENLIESIYREDSLRLKVGAVDAMGRSCNENWLPLLIKEMGSYVAGERESGSADQPRFGCQHSFRLFDRRCSG